MVGKSQATHYALLYQFQDEILKAIFQEVHSFYLTGGTALSRFFLHHRYSDDLDLFSSDSVLFNEMVRTAINALPMDVTSREQVGARDFKRYILHQDRRKLQVDFVCDRVQRIGTSRLLGGIAVDNETNILTNKLGAVLDRDVARDVVDVVALAHHRSWDWNQIIKKTQKKVAFASEDLAYRIKTFPLRLLKEIAFIPGWIQPDWHSSLQVLLRDLDSGGENSLGKGKPKLS